MALYLNDSSIIILDAVRCRQDMTFKVVSQGADADENVVKVSAFRLIHP